MGSQRSSTGVADNAWLEVQVKDLEADVAELKAERDVLRRENAALRRQLTEAHRETDRFRVRLSSTGGGAARADVTLSAGTGRPAAPPPDAKLTVTERAILAVVDDAPVLVDIAYVLAAFNTPGKTGGAARMTRYRARAALDTLVVRGLLVRTKALTYHRPGRYGRRPSRP